MLRTRVIALAGFAAVFSAQVQAETSTAAAPALNPTIIAKAEEGTAPLSDAQSAPQTAPDTAAPKGPEPVTTAAIEDTKPADAAKPAPSPSPTLTVNIDLASQRMTVSENGVAKHTWPISSGTRSHATPRGTFRPQWSAKMWYSRKYDNAPMPHAVFIHGGVAIHATYATGMLGRPASHGCIRLAPSNAKTFYNLVHKHGYKMTRVSVHGTPNFGKEYIAKRSPTKQRYAAAPSASNWDWFGSNGAPVKVKPRAPKVYRYANGTVVSAKKPPRVVYRQVPRSNSLFGY